MKKAELQYKAKLADMACMICERLYGQHPGGNVELHHLRTGGWGRGDYKTLIPLCVEHHRGNSGIHGMGTKAWERAYGMSWTDCMRSDIAELVKCDAIRLLHGWENSKGATLEHHIAERLGLQIFTPDAEISAP